MCFLEKRNIFVCFFICLSLGQAVYAVEVNVNYVRNYIGGYDYTLILNIIKIFLSVFIIEILGSIVNVFWLQKSDIVSVNMELLIQKPINEEEYEVWQCDKIFFNSKKIEKSELRSPYSLLITIKMGNTEWRKKNHTIVLRKLIIEENNYTYIYIPEKTKELNYRKCKVSIDNDMCCFLLEPPKANVMKCNEMVDIFSFFNKPDQVKMYIEFFDAPKWFSLCNSVFSKTRMILFEKKSYFQRELRIEIHSRKILRRKYKNGVVESRR